MFDWSSLPPPSPLCEHLCHLAPVLVILLSSSPSPYCCYFLHRAILSISCHPCCVPLCLSLPHRCVAPSFQPGSEHPGFRCHDIISRVREFKVGAPSAGTMGCWQLSGGPCSHVHYCFHWSSCCGRRCCHAYTSVSPSSLCGTTPWRC